MQTRTILIVEDDSDINTLLARIMEREGYLAIQAFSGTEALLQLDHAEIDLILLDMMLPGIDGPSFIAALRNDRESSVPVVVVSAKAGLSDKIDMLAQGADDYIVKPFEPEEVAARVQAVLRRVCSNAAGNNQESYVYRDLCLDVSTRRVSLNGVELFLTAHEFDILHTLIQEPDKVFSRELLYELVWKGGYYGEDNAVNVHVSNIRKKLAAIDPQSVYVKTVWGIGFKLS